MALTTVADVSTYTGVTVDSSAVAQAQFIIELFSNRTEAASGSFTDRDSYWMKMAVAYQAAYMDSHPEVFNLMDVNSINQGDLSVNFKKDASFAIVAPLARMALARTSWSRTRSIRVNSDFITELDNVTDDGPGAWHPIGHDFGY